MNPKWSNYEIASKVDYEGGIFSALEYGITASQIEDPRLAKLWSYLEAGYAAMQSDIDEVQAIFDKAMDEHVDDDEG